MRAPGRIEQARQSAECLYPAEQVTAAIDRLAVRLSVTLAEENPLLLCVLNGGLPFTAALMQRLHFPLTLCYVHVGRYGDATRGGELSWYARPREDLTGRHVVLVDDILDEGVTLRALEAWCLEAGAAAVTTAVLLEKGEPGRATFAALPCPDRYVFGWGMDFEGYWRNLPAIYALADAMDTEAGG